MGLLSKLKNVLFEEEVIELPESEPKRIVKESIPKVDKKQVKMSFESEKESEPVISDRELFKAEKTFNFPPFDPNEFESMKSTPLVTEEEEEPKSMSINLFDYDRPKVKKEETKQVKKASEIRGRAYPKEKREVVSNQKFKPSPVISPVYGVLGNNYNKEDIVVEKEVVEKRQIDVDDVRKKAFGTLESDIEKTLSKPIDEFYKEEEVIEDVLPVIEKPKKRVKKEEEEKSIEDLLEESVFDTIDVPDTKEIKEKDVKLEEEVKEESKLEDTLESDLFDLIDSMYEDKEEE